MNTRIFKQIIVFSFIFVFISSFITDVKADTVDKADLLINGILNYNLDKSGYSDAQEWIDKDFSDDISSVSIWYVLGLIQGEKDYDFSEFSSALSEYLTENEIKSAVGREKMALILMACGDTQNSYINETLDNSTGQQGIISWIYGLHLINNGASSEKFTSEYVVNELLSMQLSDGGWALTGEYGDIDVTAMTLQALSPYYTSDNVKSAIDKAIIFMSEKQLSDGDYSSFGTENPESGCQVIAALSSLKIDCADDERFIKNGNTLIDGIEKYILSDGSFSHTLDGESNSLATSEVFFALVSYQRMCNDESSVYIFQNDKSNVGQKISFGIKTTISIVLSAAGIIICVIFIIMKKRNAVNYIVVTAITIILIVAVNLMDIRKKEDYYSNSQADKGTPVGTVTMTIRCDTIAGKEKVNDYIPDNYIILDSTEFNIYENYSVFDVLSDAAKEYNIQTENDRGTGVYIRGINYLYEFDYGELSGWMYYVNGNEADITCSDYKVSDGDNIEWLYTCNLGHDLQ